MDDNLPRRVSDSLDQATAALGGARSSAIHALWVRWRELVGPTVADHATPLSLKHHTLTIAVDHPGWATQLRFLEPTLLANLSAALGPDEVQRVEVRVQRPEEGKGRGTSRRF